MPDVLTKPWWIWNPQNASLGDQIYRGFNLLEAAVWFVFGLLVFIRWMRTRNSLWEIVYSLAFIAFGLSDVAEAREQSPPLLATKGVILAVLLALRHVVRQRWYPASRVY
jgi:hypothetical protein